MHNMTVSLDQIEARQEAALVPQPWSSLGKTAYEAIVEGILTGALYHFASALGYRRESGI
jgi:hypothetical protein